MTTFRLDHIGVRLDPATGSFALWALDAGGVPTPPRALFTGFVHPGMADELRRLADAFEAIEARAEGAA